MKKLDWYIFRKFLGTFFYALLLFIAISVVIDITERLDDLMESEASIWETIRDYYLNFIPYISILLSPLFIFISVIFFTSKLAYRSEIVAVLSSGISFNRFLYPYFLAAILLTGFLLFMNHVVVPKANKGRIAYEDAYLRHEFVYADRNVHMQLKPENFAYFERYDNRKQVGYKLSLEEFKDGKLAKKLMSERFLWNDSTERWEIENGFIRTFNGDQESVKEFLKLDTTLTMHPDDFSRKDNIKEAMTTKELAAYIKVEDEKGLTNTIEFVVEKLRRTASPVSTFILTLIGVAIASKKVRGGMGLHLAVGIGIAALYIMCQQFSMTYSIQGSLSPMMGVWIPNIIFGAFSIFLLKIAPK